MMMGNNVDQHCAFGVLRHRHLYNQFIRQQICDDIGVGQFLNSAPEIRSGQYRTIGLIQVNTG